MNSLNLWFTCVFLEKKKKKVTVVVYFKSDSIFVLLVFTTGYQD